MFPMNSLLPPLQGFIVDYLALSTCKLQWVAERLWRSLLHTCIYSGTNGKLEAFWVNIILRTNLVMLWPAYMRRRLIKILASSHYLLVNEDTKDETFQLTFFAFLFSVFLLLIIKSAPENTLYGNEKTVNIPFPTAWFTKSFMKTVNFMSYFPDPSKGGTITEINTSTTRPWILSTSNYYLTPGSPCPPGFSPPSSSALVNHTQEGNYSWILIFIYTACLWCPPSPP